MKWEDVIFINFDDFYQNRKLLRMNYAELSLDDKWLLKKFIYHELKECTSDKDVIWNYLNENEGCKKELASRVRTRKCSRKYNKNNCNFNTVQEIEKRKKIETKRIDLFGLLED